MGDLGNRAVRGGAATIGSSAVVLLVNLVALLVLSRMLDPRDFGIVAMVQAIISFGEILKNAGLTTSALQAPRLSEQQAANLFWLNALLSASIAAVIVASTGLIVALYHEPVLSKVVPLMALSLFLNGVGAQIRVQLARRMRFGVLAVSSVLSQVVAVIVAILMAWAGMGFWALVGQTVVTSAMSLAVESGALRWRPSLPRRRQGTKALVVVGVHYWLNDVLSFIQTNASTIVLGRKFGAVALGSYNRANQVASLPVGGVLGPLMRVVLPVLNTAKRAGQQAGPIILMLQATVGAVFVAALAAASGSSQKLVPLILGGGWGASASFFAVLALGASVEVLNYFSHWALMHDGQSRAILHFNLIARPMVLVGLIVGSYFGVLGAATGFVITQALMWPLNFIWISRIAEFPWKPMLTSGFYILTSGLISAAVGHWSSAASESMPYGVALSLASSVLVFSLLVLAHPRLRREAFSGARLITRTFWRR